VNVSPKAHIEFFDTKCFPHEKNIVARTNACGCWRAPACADGCDDLKNVGSHCVGIIECNADAGVE